MPRGQSSGTSRRLAVTTAAVVLLSYAGAICAQTGTFTASAVVFAPTGTNDSQAQNVDITVTNASAITSISIPLAFIGQPEFTLVDQGGCKFDGVTVNSAGTICHMLVRFHPASAGKRNASLLISDAIGNKTSIGLSGVGYYPQVAITPAAAKIVAGLGPGNSVFSGDGDTAFLAGISAPQGITADSFGNVYFADTGNNLVRMLDAFGNITTVAGGGTMTGVTADGGPATAASLSRPTWLETDAAGNLYISDSGNNVVRLVMMSTSRVITTVAGNYSAGLSNGTSATTAQLKNPQGLALDAAGNLFIVDAGNSVIRRVDAVTALITTVAGAGTPGFNAAPTAALSAQFKSPTALAIDTAGNLFVSDTGNHAVREISNGSVSVVAGTGAAGNSGDGAAATSADLGSPAGVAVSPGGDVYLVDTQYGIVRKVQASDGVIETVAGMAKDAGSYTSGVQPSTNLRMNLPIGLAFDPWENLYLTDTGNNVVREISPSPGDLAFAAQAVGNKSGSLTLKIANIGNAPMGLVSIAAANTATSNNYALANSSTEACGVSLAVGTHCSYDVTFAPLASGFVPGEIDVTHVSNNPNFNTAEPVYLSGGLMTALSISPGTLDPVVAGQAINLPVTITGGFGAITTDLEGVLPNGLTASTNGTTITLSGSPSQVGTFSFTVFATDILGDTATNTYSLIVLPAVITTTITETMHLTDTPNELPGLQLAVTEAMHLSDTATELPSLTVTVVESLHLADAPTLLPTVVLNIIETIQAADGPLLLPPAILAVTEAIQVNDGLSEVPAVYLPINEVIGVTDSMNDLPSVTLAITEAILVSDAVSNTVGKLPQTITAPSIPDHLYGDGLFTVDAVSSAGLPVTITVKSGKAVVTNGSIDLSGAGAVTLVFAQAGDANTFAAKSVEATFNVVAAVASVTVVNASRVFETTNPALTYRVTGLVHGDTAEALLGIPALSTSAVLNSPAGTYPIAVAIGTISTPNYSVSLVPGALTIIGHIAQVITFGVIPNTPSTITTLTLTAHSTSGLPITYVVTGPATLTRNQLRITGAGTVSVIATQSGNATFDAATSVQRTFTVTP